jgi:hypothetical protein
MAIAFPLIIWKGIVTLASLIAPPFELDGRLTKMVAKEV